MSYLLVITEINIIKNYFLDRIRKYPFTYIQYRPKKPISWITNFKIHSFTLLLRPDSRWRCRRIAVGLSTCQWNLHFVFGFVRFVGTSEAVSELCDGPVGSHSDFVWIGGATQPRPCGSPTRTWGAHASQQAQAGN